MRKALLGGVVAAALTISTPANAGCWATVGLSPMPDGLAAGETWTAKLTVLQHGRTPLGEASPRVTIVNASTGERRSFAAQPTDPAAGRYEAQVVFPAGGTWRYRVHDGFTTLGGEPVPCARTHTFAPVEIAGPPAAGGGGGVPPWAFAAGGIALLAAAGAVGLLLRRNGSRAPAAA
jgi:hypothetical protein